MRRVTAGRRQAPLMLSAALALALAACGGEVSSGGGGGGETVSGVAAEPVDCGSGGEYLIGMSQSNLAEPYRAQMNKDIQRFADEVPQFSVEFTDAHADSAAQAQHVRTYISKGVDLLIISPHQAAPLTQPVAEAYEAGIPVLVLDRAVDGSTFTSYIGGDNTKMGYLAGEHVAQEILPDGGNVIVLYGLPGSPPAAERFEGFQKAIADQPDIKVVDKLVANWFRDEAQKKMDAALKAHQDIDVVFAENDPMALGGYIAAEQAGRAEEIAFTGMDGLAIPGGGLVAVLQDKLAFTVPYPTGGEKAIELAKQILLDCEQVPEKVTLPTQVVTKKEAADFYREKSGGQEPPVG